MAQEIRHFTWCDLCTAEAPDDATAHEPGETFTVLLDDGRPMTVDLCERHDKTMLQPVRDLLATYGYRADMSSRVAAVPTTARDGRNGPKPQADRAIGCLWCPQGYASTTGLANHLVTVHGFPFTDGQKTLKLGSVFNVGACPLCGAEHEQMQPLGVHVTRAHPDVPNAIAAFSAARDLGDPHGLVAKVIAKAPGGQYVARATTRRRRS